ncbi:hypothetical protein HDU97_003018 [Phlyctochytrium planicorne]|nr:hypothetical protein HDU97_003018 [Phlyctochytrium planicorne]
MGAPLDEVGGAKSIRLSPTHASSQRLKWERSHLDIPILISASLFNTLYVLIPGTAFIWAFLHLMAMMGGSIAGISFHPGNVAALSYSFIGEFVAGFTLTYPLLGPAGLLKQFLYLSIPRTILEIGLVVAVTIHSSANSTTLTIVIIFLTHWAGTFQHLTVKPDQLLTKALPPLDAEKQLEFEAEAEPASRSPKPESAEEKFAKLSPTMKLVSFLVAVYILNLLQGMVENTPGLASQRDLSSSIFLMVISYLQTIVKITRFGAAGPNQTGATMFWSLCIFQVIFERILPRASKVINILNYHFKKRAEACKVQVEDISSTTNEITTVEFINQNQSTETDGRNLDVVDHQLSVSRNSVVPSDHRTFGKDISKPFRTETVKKVMVGTIEVISKDYDVSRNDHAYCSFLSTIVSGASIVLLQRYAPGFPDYSRKNPDAAQNTLPTVSTNELMFLCGIYLAGEVLCEALFLCVEKKFGELDPSFLGYCSEFPKVCR